MQSDTKINCKSSQHISEPYEFIMTSYPYEKIYFFLALILTCLPVQGENFKKLAVSPTDN